MNLRDWLAAMQRPPALDDEDDGAYTDRMVREGAARGVNRQCSIGWHDECSDPDGDSCRCVCHMAVAPSYGQLARWLAFEMDEGDRLRRLLYQAITSAGDDPADYGVTLDHDAGTARTDAEATDG